MVEGDQHFLQVFFHLAEFFVNVSDASVEACQIGSIDASWFAGRKAVAESSNGAVTAGSPFVQNKNSLFNFEELSFELGCHRVDGQDVAAAPRQFVQFVS